MNNCKRFAELLVICFLFYFVLFRFVLFCFVLFSFVLFLFCFVLFCFFFWSGVGRVGFSKRNASISSSALTNWFSFENMLIKSNPVVFVFIQGETVGKSGFSYCPSGLAVSIVLITILRFLCLLVSSNVLCLEIIT